MEEFEDLGVLNINSSLYKTRLSSKFLNRKPYQKANPKLVISFIPGTVREIKVQEGQEIKKGDDLMVLDAMKMQNLIKCTTDGKIKKILVKKGEKVPKGIALIEMV